MILSTVTVRRASDPSRWVRLTMSLRAAPDGAKFVEYAPGFRCQITPADSEAAGYQDANWLSGLLSGLGYAWRRWTRPGQGVYVSEVQGRLGYADMGGVAFAASVAVYELLGEPHPYGSSDWRPDDEAHPAPPIRAASAAPA